MRNESDQHSDDSQDPSYDEEPSELVSLEQLGSVYAKVLQGGSPVAEPSQDVDSVDGPVAFHGTISIHGETDGTPVSIGSILEAILFVGTRDGQAISLDQLSTMMKEFTQEEIAQGIDLLQQSLVAQQSSVQILQDESGYRLKLTNEIETVIEQLKWGGPKEAVLSQAAVDCLSLVAYQPGILRQELEEQLGQGTGAILATLQRRGLIAMNSDGFHTTERFLEIVGIDSLEQLPKADDL
jgi:segregation and condensation protein B